MSKTDKIPKEIVDKIKSTNQTHLLEAFNKCKSPQEENDFLAQLKEIDFELVDHLYKRSQSSNLAVTYNESSISKIECQYPRESFINQEEELSKIGYEYIAQGKVATLLLSGGLGTRLGFNHPKGQYNIKMPSNKSLFNYFANRFLSCQLVCRERVKDQNLKIQDCLLLIMTSTSNDKEVREYFAQNNYFGIKKENVIFFPQSQICGVSDKNGEILMETPTKIFMSPDGNGGCLLALKKYGIIEKCIERGVEFINVTSIDNPLYKLMDPLCIGLTISKGKNGKDQMTAKYIKKVDPEQKVGYFLIFEDKPLMLDYMEMPEKLKYEKLSNGDLKYNAANILDYIISVSFLKKVLYEENNIKKLLDSFHVIKKKMTNYNIETKNPEEKKNLQFYKFEIFFNSIFEFCNKDGLLLMEIEEEDEFAPVKNDESQSKCNANTARLQMSNLCKKWFKANSGQILNDDPAKYLEISFLISYDGKNLFSNPSLPKSIDFKDVKAGEGIYFKNKDLEK